MSGATGNLTSGLSGATGNLTSGLSGAAGNLTSGLSGKLNTNVDLKIPSGKLDLFKNVKPHCGMFALPDDFPLANFAKFLNLPFMPALPEFSLADFNTPIPPDVSFPKVFSDSILCLIEKFINGFIDFIWALMGIEVIIDPPHIKLCKKKTPNESNKLNNGDIKPDENLKEIESTVPFIEKAAFVYEVTFDDGRKEVIKDYESLIQFMEQNKDTNFDLNI